MEAEWSLEGACLDSEPDALFVRGAAQQMAKQVCMSSPVIAECLADALDNHTEFGVRGGMTERERRALLKSRPGVRSWRALFEADRLRSERAAAEAEEKRLRANIEALGPLVERLVGRQNEKVLVNAS